MATAVLKIEGGSGTESGVVRTRRKERIQCARLA